MEEFPEDSFEAKIMKAVAAIEKEAALKKEVKEKSAALHNQTKALIEGMNEESALVVLEEKWITPIVSEISALPERLIARFIEKLEFLAEKYNVTFSDVGTRIESTEANVSGYVSKMIGDAFDMEALNELRKLLGGE